MIPKWRVLGEALCFVLFVPVLLFALFLLAMKLVSPTFLPKFQFLLFALCGMSQIIASLTLRARNAWGFGWAKFGSYILDLIALLLLFLSIEWTFIVGYYIVHPHAPPLFGN